MFNKEKTDAVLWDLDDTLYSRRAAARVTFFGMFRELLYENRDDAFIAEAVDYMMSVVQRNSMVAEASFAALLEKYPPDKPYVRESCLDYYYLHMPENAIPFPDQIEVVKRLRAMGKKNAIVTNIPVARAADQRRKIEALGISHLFEVILISGELDIHKPDRRIFDLAAERLGVDNSRCVFVGDDPTADVRGALGAGMEAVWFDEFECSDAELACDPRVSRVSSVFEYFKI